jgi:type IV secretion system protein TrbE
MLRLKRIFKNYQETGSFNELVNLYGFIDSHVFLTKTGAVGAILEVQGVDYECLDGEALDQLTKRLESALKLFDENYRVYQYLFKRNNETIPYTIHSNPVVNAAMRNRIAYLQGRADNLFSLSLYIVVLFEAAMPTDKMTRALGELSTAPAAALKRLLARFFGKKQIDFLHRAVSRAQTLLRQKVDSFIVQVSDFVAVRMLDKDHAFRLMKRTLNFSSEKIEHARLKHDTFLDYYLPESHLECHRGHLRLDDYYVKVLTLKEPSAQSFPLIFKTLRRAEMRR